MAPYSSQPLPAFIPCAPRACSGGPEDSCKNRCTGNDRGDGVAGPRRLSRRAMLPLTVAALLPLSVQSARSELLELSEAEWRERLDFGQYRVLRQSGTERPFSSPLNSEKRAGDYVCAACDSRLFASDAKFDSGTGWPSFWAPADEGRGVALVQSVKDRLLMQREVRCKKCGGHLGHVFKDGPRPTGLRYCINGVAMKFEPRV